MKLTTVYQINKVGDTTFPFGTHSHGVIESLGRSVSDTSSDLHPISGGGHEGFFGMEILI